jgi:hypothetical protein
VEDPYEWNNLAGDTKYDSIIREMKKAAPAIFSPEATSRNELRLIVKGDGFHWERKRVPAQE